MPVTRSRARSQDAVVQPAKKRHKPQRPVIPVDIYSGEPLKKGSNHEFVGQPNADVLAHARVADDGEVYPVNFKKVASVPYIGGAAHEKQKQKTAMRQQNIDFLHIDPAVKPSEHSNEDIIPHGKYETYKTIPKAKQHPKEFYAVLMTMGAHRHEIQADLYQAFKKKTHDFTSLLKLMYNFRFLFYSEATRKMRANEAKTAVASGSLARLLYLYIDKHKKEMDGHINPDLASRRAPREFLLDVLHYHLMQLKRTAPNLHLPPAENKKKQQPWAQWLRLLNDILPYLAVSTSAENDWRKAIKDVYRAAFPTSNKNYQAIQGILEIGDKSQLSAALVQRIKDFNVTFAMAPHRTEMAAAKQGRAVARQNTSALDFTESSILAAKKAMIDSSFFLDKALLVELSVGARMIEVLKVSDFYLPEQLYGRSPPMGDPGSFQPGTIVQHGVAKDRDKVQIEQDDDGHIKVVDIQAKDTGDFDKQRREAQSVRTLKPKPVLFNLQPEYIRYLVYEVIRPTLITFLMQHGHDGMSKADATHLVRGDGSNKALTKKIAHIMIRRTKELFPGSAIVGTHTLRKIYANYSYDTYADKKITRNAWIQQVLGHAPGAIATSISYTGVVVTRPLAIAPPDWVNQHAQLVSSVEALDETVTRAVKQTVKEASETDTVIIDGRPIKKAQRTREGIEKRAELLLEKYKELKAKNIEPSRSKLRRLGFGSAAVSYFKQNYQAEIN